MGWADFIRYTRVHRANAILLGVATVALTSALLGGTHIPVPTAEEGSGSIGIPFRRELPLLSAVFLTAALGGPLSAHEAVGGPRAHRVRTACVVALTCVACVGSFLAETLAVGPALGIVFVRSMLIWLGFALMSAQLFGTQLAWIFPLASAFPLVWFSNNAWWDWTATPAADPLSWVVATLALFAGIAATACTPWRRHMLFGLRSHNHTTEQPS